MRTARRANRALVPHPMTFDPPRKPWREGAQEGATPASWLSLDDDDLLQRIETFEPREESDGRLLEVVQSDRHFFIRQEAAKRIRNKRLLFPYEDDRHIGQVLVRRLTRREDLTYLERLVARSQHSEVRSAAQAQLARLRKKLAGRSANASIRERQEEKPGPWRVALIHEDAEIRRTLANSLPHPEFQICALDPREESLQRLPTFDPHIILADVHKVLGDEHLNESIRARAGYVPLVVVCPSDMRDSLLDLLGHGADEFIMLPLHAALLTAKVRALIHFAHRTAPKMDRQALSGPIGSNGALPLFKMCEEQNLTCRLIVTTGTQQRWVEFLDGEMIDAGGEPPASDDEALAAILDVKSGRYEITDRLLEDPEDASTTLTPGVTSKPRAFLSVKSSRPISPSAPDGREAVDVSLLGWAIHFIVEQAWIHLGTTVTTGLLRQTHQDLLEQHPMLNLFSIEENARVGVDLSRGARLPRGAVVAVALWMASFLYKAHRIAPEIGQLRVRQATALMVDALDQMGFYAAYDVARTRFARSLVEPPGSP
ncbi:MAG: response regulator [Vicinamibacteria bacterium]|nr:response regulator [Vicinamibacteria bacterium]